MEHFTGPISAMKRGGKRTRLDRGSGCTIFVQGRFLALVAGEEIWGYLPMGVFLEDWRDGENGREKQVRHGGGILLRR